MLVLASGGLIVAASAAPSAQLPPAEYDVKAAFLLNFAKFVDWPDDAFGPGTPLALCVVGDDPFGEVLDRLARDEQVNGRALVVRRLRAADDMRSCHVAFISASERRRLPQVVEALRGARTLTVGDMDEFTRAGGMIRFTKENFRVGLEVNPAAAARAGLRISSRLLSLAAIVPDQPVPGGS